MNENEGKTNKNTTFNSPQNHIIFFASISSKFHALFKRSKRRKIQIVLWNFPNIYCKYLSREKQYTNTPVSIFFSLPHSECGKCTCKSPFLNFHFSSFSFFFSSPSERKKLRKKYFREIRTKKISDAYTGFAMRTRSRRKSNYSTISTVNTHRFVCCAESGANWFEMQ